MANSELIQRITDFLSSSSEDISKKELTVAISKLYDEMKKPEKKEDKIKRPPTAYNIFMQEQMAKLKEEESKMTGKEKMSHIAKLWKAKKESDSEGEKDEDKEDKKAKKSKKKSK
jgi:hypothetical protein